MSEYISEPANKLLNSKLPEQLLEQAKPFFTLMMQYKCSIKEVEVQFRTIAMDFWASLEHKLKYKKDIEDSESIVEELKKCADVISEMDYRMQEIRSTIETGGLS